MAKGGVSIGRKMLYSGNIFKKEGEK